MRNEIKKAEPQKQQQKRVMNKRSRRFVEVFQSIIDGTFLTRENFVKQLPFLLFIVLIALCYIANTYYTEKMVREIDKTKNELKELRSEYITIKSDYMIKSKQSEVAKIIDEKNLGIKESLDAPKKIISDRKEKQDEEI
ncbi:MAG: FtsL-like putative cell division protein [Bacteroidales bacterium]|nr:FtsL-like putative cell division protein [Bacteroidales bacterium]